MAKPKTYSPALVTALSRVAPFTPSEAEAIVSRGTLVTVPSEWAPMAEGTPPDKVYLLVSGEVSVRKGREEVARLSAGSIVGELALARRSLRTATVVTKTPVTALHFTRSDWEAALAAVPRLSQAVAALTADRS